MLLKFKTIERSGFNYTGSTPSLTSTGRRTIERREMQQRGANGQQTLEEVRARRRNNDESLNKSPSPSTSPQRNADQGSPIGGNNKPDPDDERKKGDD
jgi:hypothetical protein